VYLLQTKLHTELPEDILNDIEYALYDYGKQCTKVSETEKAYWRDKVLGTYKR
jgi:hypothetical protein